MDFGKNQKGNVLFMILIAVILFAALSYAITSSNRMNGNSISDDKDKIDSAQIVQECAKLRNTALRFMFTGVTADELLVNDGTAVNKPCRTGNKCLFSATGGQAIIPIPPQVKGNTNGKFKGAPTPIEYRYYHISNGAFLTGYDSNKPLVIFEAFPLSLALCEKLNVAVGRSPTPEFQTTSDPNFRDGCYNDGSTLYLFRCPLTH